MPDTAGTWNRPQSAPWQIDREALRHFIREARRHGRHAGPPPFGRPGFGHGRGFPFAGPGFDFGGGRRAGRGDIRAAILALLNEQPMHGYQIMQELEQRTGGEWRVSPGSVYPTLQQLQDEALITSTEQPGGRRVFELTDAGREHAKSAAATPPWQDPVAAPESTAKALKQLLMQVAAATWQVTKTGSASQQAQAHEVLREARKRLYQLLAEDDAAQS